MRTIIENCRVEYRGRLETMRDFEEILPL